VFVDQAADILDLSESRVRELAAQGAFGPRRTKIVTRRDSLRRQSRREVLDLDSAIVRRVRKQRTKAGL